MTIMREYYPDNKRGFWKARLRLSALTAYGYTAALRVRTESLRGPCVLGEIRTLEVLYTRGVKGLPQ